MGVDGQALTHETSEYLYHWPGLSHPVGPQMLLAPAIILTIPLVTPLQFGEAWCETGGIAPADGTTGDAVGSAVAIEGGVLVIGAPEASSAGVAAGVVRVYERVSPGMPWIESARLAASDGAAGDAFGQSVALSGDVLVVGAWADDDQGADSGSAYVFERSGPGAAWLETGKLLASDGATGASFGWSVAVEGNDLVVGSPMALASGATIGGSYVFERPAAGSPFVETAKLLVQSGQMADLSGYAVSLGGDVIAMGCPLANDLARDAGLVQIFERSGPGAAWFMTDKLMASNGNQFDLFGKAVSVVGDTLVIGAPYRDSLAVNSGSVYTFERPPGGGAWTESVETVGPGSTASAWFGASLALGQNGLVVGAPWEDFGSPGGGALCVYERTAAGSPWALQDSLASASGPSGGGMGSSVDLSGIDVVGGAPAVGGGTASTFVSLPAGTLTSSPCWSSLAAGGTVAMSLDAGPGFGGMVHVVVGSVTGTSPGTVFDGFLIPLIVDAYTVVTLERANQGPLFNNLGQLDAAGKSVIMFAIPAGLDPSLAGLAVFHAALVLDLATGIVVHASNALPVHLLP